MRIGKRTVFENVFQKLGRKISKNSGKVIIIWIAILVVFAPFSIVFFQNVNFNIASNIVSKNSMSNQAQNLLNQEFGSSGTNSSAADQVVIFANNTYIGNISNYHTMLNLQSSLSSYLSTNSSFTGIDSITSEMNTAISTYATSIAPELNGTYQLVQSTASGLAAYGELLNETLGIEYGFPLQYVQAYSQAYSINGNNSTLANSNCYSNYSSMLSLQNNSNGIPGFQLAYLNTFIPYWNATLSVDNNLNNSIYSMNSSVHSSLPGLNPLAEYVSAKNNTTLFSLYGEMLSVNANFSLFGFLNPAEVNAFLEKTSLLTVSSGLQAPESIQLLNALGIGAYTFTRNVYNLSINPLPGSLSGFAVKLVANSSVNLFSSNPAYRINNATIVPFLSALLGNSTSQVTNQWFNNFTLAEQPLVPTQYLRSSLVGNGFSSMLIILSFSSNVSQATVNGITNHSNSFLGDINGLQLLYTTSNAQSNEVSNQFTNGLIIALAIGISLSILLIGIFFKSPIAAFLPLMMFLFSAIISMGINGILYKYVFHTQVSFITPTLLLILVLGLTTDYMVYIMARYRRELKSGNPEAAAISAKWSGHAVFTSGLTVALAYLVLWLSDIPIFSDSGLTNAIGVAITIFLANTLLIAMLSRSGTKIFWPTKISLQGKIPLEGAMRRVAHFSVNNKKKLLLILSAVSIVCILFYETTATGLDVFALLPSNEATNIVQGVNYTFGGDTLDRNYVIVEFSSPIYTNVSGNITFNANEMTALNAIEGTIINQPGVAAIQGPTYPFGYQVPYNLSNVSSAYTQIYLNQMLTFIGNSSNYAQIQITMKSLAWAPISSAVTKNIDNNLSSLEGSYAFTYYMGGTSQGISDVFSYASSTFLVSLPILIAAIFAVLFVQLYAIFTPVRLIIMVLLAVVISLAFTYFIINSLMHFALIIFLPIFVVITLLAVGLDYDIFMITRVREEMIKGETTEAAITKTIEENGGVIITLGLLLFVTFISLSFTGIPIMYEIGLGLALGVIIDTFVSWPFFVPVVMLYLKKYNWWPSKIEDKVHLGKE